MQTQIVLTKEDAYEIRKILFEARMLIESENSKEPKEKIISDLRKWQELLKI